MKNARNVIVSLLLVVMLLAPYLTLSEGAISTLSTGNFPVGTFVVPMDGKQNDRVHVYGFIHEFLRTSSTAQVARVIEPPDVTMQTALTPNSDVYQGGPYLIDSTLKPYVNLMLSNSTFAQVTVTQLTAPFNSNNIFFVRQPTRILVIYGVFGRTDLTLSRMGISYTLVQASDVEQDPSILNQYTLIVDDCPGWFGNSPSYNPDRRTSIQNVYNTIQSRVQSGNEVIFTDIAILDLNATFPGYITPAQGGAGSWVSTIHNPPVGFSAEFPSQYYNPPPNPTSITLFTEGGGWVASGVQPAHQSDVRILIDSNQFGVPYRYAILGFYFPFGNGIVEDLAFHPYEQLYPNYADQNGYYATYEIYGNKFVHGPQSDLSISATPATVTVNQGQTATYTVGVTSIGTFSSPVSLQVTGIPPGSSGTFNPPVVTPPPSGTTPVTLTVPTSLATPIGSYDLTITGNSASLQITRSAVVTLIVKSAPADFTINANPRAPTPLIVRQTFCGNISVMVQSIGNFSSPVNLAISPVPQNVAVQFLPNTVTPSPGGASVISILRVCPASNAQPGDYAMTIRGTSGSLTHTVDVIVRVPTVPAPVVNPLIYFLVLLLLLLALGIGFLAVFMSRKPRKRPRALYVLPLPTIQCRTCRRLMPLASVYCPYCGKPQVVVSRRPTLTRRSTTIGGRSLIGFILSLVSGILVLLNSAALLSPSFYGPPVNWSSIFWWIRVLGQTYAFTLGLLIGLTLVLSSVIMLLRSGALADVLILPFAVFSLIIGGGFVAGMVLGIVGGIIGALKR